jgi:hypothetical protein
MPPLAAANDAIVRRLSPPPPPQRRDRSRGRRHERECRERDSVMCSDDELPDVARVPVRSHPILDLAAIATTTNMGAC